MPTKRIINKASSKKTTQSSHTAKKSAGVKVAKAVKIPAKKSVGVKTAKTVKIPAKKLLQPARVTLKPLPTVKAGAKQAPVKGIRASKLQKIKGLLLQQKAALLSEAELALNELPEQSAFPDMGDQASAETDTNFMLRLRGREQRLLKKIDEALERIDSSTFGICDDCGQEIDVKRLEARPVTTMCIECKIHQEEDEKRRKV